LQRVLSRLPLSLKDQGIWFSDTASALKSAGTSFRSWDTLVKRSENKRAVYMNAYLEAHRGLGPKPVLLMRARDDHWSEIFGFHWLDVKLTAHTGTRSTKPLQVTYLEGEFDTRSIKKDLDDLGYEERRTAGQSCLTVREDFAIDPQDEGSSLALNSMNRVFVRDDLLIAAPSTRMFVPVLETWDASEASLMDDPAFGHLAELMGSPLSAALLTSSSIFQSEEAEGPTDEAVQDLPTPPPWEALGAGFYRNSDGNRWWCYALAYPDPDAAAINAPRVAEQMRGFTTTVPSVYSEVESQDRGAELRIFDQYCYPGIQRKTETWSDGSALAIWCPLSEDAPAGLWHVLIDVRDLDFLMP
jgi:hypothetical protein